MILKIYSLVFGVTISFTSCETLSEGGRLYNRLLNSGYPTAVVLKTKPNVGCIQRCLLECSATNNCNAVEVDRANSICKYLQLIDTANVTDYEKDSFVASNSKKTITKTFKLVAFN